MNSELINKMKPNGMNVSVADRADRREAHASPRIVKINRPAMSALNKPGTEGCETVIE